MKPKRFVHILERFGFVLDRQKGSHATFVHKDGRRVTISMHPSDIPHGTLRGILKDIELTTEDLK